MRKVLIYSVLLFLGLGLSQVLPSLLGDRYDALAVAVRVLTMTGLAFIMIHVGYEFEIDKGNLRQYGKDYLSKKPRRFQTKSRTAQEAHEAIRPTDVTRTPAKMAGFLEAEELALYRLIWNRTVASQMANARLDKTAVDFRVDADGRDLTFRSNGSIVTFPGFLRVYGDRDRDSLLPELAAAMRVGTGVADPGRGRRRRDHGGRRCVGLHDRAR